MIAVFEYPKKRAEFEAFVAENTPCHIWHDGAVMRVYTGDDMPVERVPESVTPWQIRKAINATPGMRAQVEALLSAPETSLDVKDGWLVATEWRRHDPVLLAMTAAIGLTDEQIDGLFTLAGTL